MLVLTGVVGLHRTFQLQLLQRYWLGYLDYYIIEWFALEKNKIILWFLRLHQILHFRIFC